MLRRKIRAAPLIGATSRALEEMEGFIRAATVVEPTEEEQRLAARLEVLAQREGLPFDMGESQLCAVLVLRAVPQFLTGDKRAIAALERLLEMEGALLHVVGRVRCLEQLVRLLVDKEGDNLVRSAVCAEPRIDKALSHCFSCSSSSGSPESSLEGLASYIGSLRRIAPRTLSTVP